MGHIVDVLRGSDSERIRSLGHESLSTYGLLKEVPKNVLTNQMYQLVDQGLLDRTSGDYPVMRLNERSWEVLRGERDVQLIPVRVQKVTRTRVETESWEGVDRDLFEELRKLRTELAQSRGVPPYVIFNDKSLRDMASRSLPIRYNSCR